MPNRWKQLLGLALLLVGLALGGIGLRLMLSPAQYAGTAVISVFTHTDDFAGSMGNQSQAAFYYDPYYVQSTLEIIQSPVVLSNVVVRLNLNVKRGSSPEPAGSVEIVKAIKLLRPKIHLSPVRVSRPKGSFPEASFLGLAISVTDADASKAAAIANAVAETYLDYYLNMRREMTEKGIEVLQQQYQDEEKRISLQPTNSESLLKMHKLLGEKIEVEKLDMQTPKTYLVQIVDRAMPPQKPSGPNRVLGLAIFVTGLVSLLAGLILLKPTRRQTA